MAYCYCNYLKAPMAKLANASDSKSGVRKDLQVRLLLGASAVIHYHNCEIKKLICSIMKGKYEMKLKEVIPFVDLKQTFVYVPNTLIEQMPKLNKLVNNSGEYYSKAYNPHTKKRDLVMISLSGKAESFLGEYPFELFKYVSSKKELFECEIESIESTIIDWDRDILKIVLKENQTV